MNILKHLLFALPLFAAASAHSAGTVQVTCGPPSKGHLLAKAVPTITVSYRFEHDTGIPGGFYFGALSSDEQSIAVYGASGWQAYEGGLYPLYSRHWGGFPSQITFSVQLPNNAMSTREYEGYKLFAGHGRYTDSDKQRVAERRAMLNAQKADFVQKGRWRTEYDSDDSYILSIIHNDMIKNETLKQIGVIPFVSCDPMSYR